MGLLDALGPVVANLVGTFGTSVTLRSFSEAYDPITGKNHRTAADTTVKALVEDYPAKDSMGGAMDSGGILRGDKKVTIAGSVAVPTTEHAVLIGGVAYRVVKIDTQLGTDDVMTYTCQVRR